MNGAFNKYETIEKCPVCAASNIQNHFGHDVIICNTCKVLFRSPRPTQEEIKASYDGGAVYAEWNKSDSNGRFNMWSRRLGLVTKHSDCGRLLDIGAGDGYFLSMAKAFGFSTHGTELSVMGADYAKRRGHDIQLGELTSMDYKSESFDVITIWHVLEHVPFPGMTLECIYRILKPGGILAVAVPNEENELFRRRIGIFRRFNPLSEIQWGGEIHLTHFVPSSLTRALKRVGFQILDFGVDDIYVARTLRNICILTAHKLMARLFFWHFNMAMYFVCRKPSAGGAPYQGAAL